MKIYHGTSITRCMKILEDGLIKKESCWGTLPMAEYFGKYSAKEDNSSPVFLCIEIGDDSDFEFEADYQMIDFPMCDIIGDYDRGELEESWERSEGGWKDCLEIYHSVVLIKPMKVTMEHIAKQSLSAIKNEFLKKEILDRKKRYPGDINNNKSPSP